jgi:hypothetical protein
MVVYWHDVHIIRSFAVCSVCLLEKYPGGHDKPLFIYVYTYIRTRTPGRCQLLRLQLDMYILTYIHTYIYTCTPDVVDSGAFSPIRRYTYTYIHTYTHAH